MTPSKNSNNFYQALWLGLGQIGTFVITFFSAAILARYLTKEEYGTYRQILYVYSTLMAIFTVGLPSVYAYFIPRINEGQQKKLINALNRVFLILGLIFSLSLYLLSGPIATLLKNPDLELGLKIFSPFPILTLPTLGVEGIYTAIRRTKEIAVFQIVSKLLMLIFIVGPVILIAPDYKLAIIGWGIASFLIFLMAMYMKAKPYLKIEQELIPNMYKTVFNYSLPLMGAFIAGFFILSADQFFISRYYGTEAFAEYSNGSLSIPLVAVIASSIKKVLQPIFSKAQSDGTITDAVKTYINAVNKSIILVFPIIIFAILFSNQIMTFIYGQEYVKSGLYMKYHLIRDFLEVLPYFSVFLAFGMSRIYLYMHIFGAIFVWIFGFIVVNLGLDPTMIVLVRTLFYVFSTIFALIYIYKKEDINLFPKAIQFQAFKVFFHSLVCGYITVIILKYSNMISLTPLLQLCIGGILYYILIIPTGRLLKLNYLDSVGTLLKKKG